MHVCVYVCRLYGSIGYRYDWKIEEAQKNILRTHTTDVSSRMLAALAQVLLSVSLSLDIINKRGLVKCVFFKTHPQNTLRFCTFTFYFTLTYVNRTAD